MTARRPRAVLFDLDDTLYDHRHAIGAALREVCEVAPALLTHGFDALRARYDVALEALHPRVLAGELSYEAARIERYRRLLNWVGAENLPAADLARRQAAAYRRHERLVPGAEAVLRALHAHGLRLAIVSNSTRAEQQGKLERLGVAALFDALVVSGDHGIAKPDPRLFRIALDAVGVGAPDALMIGDRMTIDVHGARSAGMQALWFNPVGAAAPAADTLRAWDPAAVTRVLAMLG
ncbi:MAG: HAD family hydrolase [Burkholderiaceae bacterium]|jgi:putative hydrolase of the HAD superfamily|nr:HAD family hydrolase [Burkholderiaceae bacterium]